ncbi:hypothetical protein RFI_13917 [Reticulomyxa filosa]|uniref:Uncharacterized protein n=1 Tax=Reticulomyxa filosa TaxID=46433 RepID=X6NBJ4_RETFI|nr:hypothetical protein RFI_13917 [Reticulomyxa filosa]|eukprot:ETO23268.1 hypothetical protein RFI_13917 [Reticulomyxa filosa]
MPLSTDLSEDDNISLEETKLKRLQSLRELFLDSSNGNASCCYLTHLQTLGMPANELEFLVNHRFSFEEPKYRSSRYSISDYDIPLLVQALKHCNKENTLNDEDKLSPWVLVCELLMDMGASVNVTVIHGSSKVDWSPLYYIENLSYPTQKYLLPKMLKAVNFDDLPALIHVRHNVTKPFYRTVKPSVPGLPSREILHIFLLHQMKLVEFNPPIEKDNQAFFLRFHPLYVYVLHTQFHEVRNELSEFMLVELCKSFSHIKDVAHIVLDYIFPDTENEEWWLNRFNYERNDTIKKKKQHLEKKYNFEKKNSTNEWQVMVLQLFDNIECHDLFNPSNGIFNAEENYWKSRLFADQNVLNEFFSFEERTKQLQCSPSIVNSSFVFFLCLFSLISLFHWDHMLSLLLFGRVIIPLRNIRKLPVIGKEDNTKELSSSNGNFSVNELEKQLEEEKLKKWKENFQLFQQCFHHFHRTMLAFFAMHPIVSNDGHVNSEKDGHEHEHNGENGHVNGNKYKEEDENEEEEEEPVHDNPYPLQFPLFNRIHYVDLFQFNYQVYLPDKSKYSWERYHSNSVTAWYIFIKDWLRCLWNEEKQYDLVWYLFSHCKMWCDDFYHGIHQVQYMSFTSTYASGQTPQKLDEENKTKAYLPDKTPLCEEKENEHNKHKDKDSNKKKQTDMTESEGVICEFLIPLYQYISQRKTDFLTDPLVIQTGFQWDDNQHFFMMTDSAKTLPQIVEYFQNMGIASKFTDQPPPSQTSVSDTKSWGQTLFSWYQKLSTTTKKLKKKLCFEEHILYNSFIRIFFSTNNAWKKSTSKRYTFKTVRVSKYSNSGNTFITRVPFKQEPICPIV